MAILFPKKQTSHNKVFPMQSVRFDTKGSGKEESIITPVLLESGSNEDMHDINKTNIKTFEIDTIPMEQPGDVY
jgi:hypothetical protein